MRWVNVTQKKLFSKLLQEAICLCVCVSVFLPTNAKPRTFRKGARHDTFLTQETSENCMTSGPDDGRDSSTGWCHGPALTYCEEKKEDITSRNVRKRGQRFLKFASTGTLLHVRKKGNIWTASQLHGEDWRFGSNTNISRQRVASSKHFNQLQSQSQF